MTELGSDERREGSGGRRERCGAEVRARMAREGRVTLEDIERLKRLASLAPHPSPALLDMLRLRFAPDVSDAAILHLMMQAEGPAAPIIRLKDDELRQSAERAPPRELPTSKPPAARRFSMSCSIRNRSPVRPPTSGGRSPSRSSDCCSPISRARRDAPRQCAPRRFEHSLRDRCGRKCRRRSRSFPPRRPL